MPTSRSIPDALWEKARRVLVFYFTHRGILNAEDLAHDTLAALLTRDDFEFSEDADFIKVCHGFARKIFLAAWRRGQREMVDLDETWTEHGSSAGGLNSMEMRVFVGEVITLAELHLTERDREAIDSKVREAVDGDETEKDGGSANRYRVQLHRARKRLGRLTGWKD
ncbi:MAG: hypothetical protein ABSH09_30285 [Bryobacteraceae bacterium]|jgi:DNA-directed RNA polymerase specialized sigma24 family protein